MKLLLAFFLTTCTGVNAFPQSASNAANSQDSQTPEAKPMRIKGGPPIVNNTLINHPQPVYSQEARDKKIQGTVIVHVVIGTDGTVKDANAISGDSLLTQSAVDAVRQWTYRPTLLNGQPVEVDSRVVVVFKLNGKKPKKSS